MYGIFTMSVYMLLQLSQKGTFISLNKMHYSSFLLGETKLIYWFTGLTDPILSKNKKMILHNFGQLTSFLSIIFCFLKKKEIKYNKLI